jgi:hypothetical protein
MSYSYRISTPASPAIFAQREKRERVTNGVGASTRVAYDLVFVEVSLR